MCVFEKSTWRHGKVLRIENYMLNRLETGRGRGNGEFNWLKIGKSNQPTCTAALGIPATSNTARLLPWPPWPCLPLSLWTRVSSWRSAPKDKPATG